MMAFTLNTPGFVSAEPAFTAPQVSLHSDEALYRTKNWKNSLGLLQ